MNREELLALREQIIGQTRELALHSDIASETRLPILLDLARSGDDEALKTAYEVAKQVEGDGVKLDSLMDVLFEVDNRLADQEEASESVENADTQGVAVNRGE